MPREPGPSTPRRQFLRHGAGALAAGGVAATAGCLGGVRDRVSPPPTAIGGTAAIPETALSHDAFTDYVETQRERYGDYGVWGTAGTEPEYDGSFAGAWTRTVGLDSEGDPLPQGGDADEERLAVADAAVAAYTIPRSEAEKRHFQLWLWAGARLPGEDEGGFLAPTAALRRVGIGVELSGDGAEMGPYTPGSNYSEGPVVVRPAAPDADGPAASFPLPDGTIRVVPEHTGFDDDAYAVQWRGDGDGVRAVAGTCEAAWADDAAPAFDLSVRTAAQRRRL